MTAAVRDDLVRLLQQIFPTKRSLLAFLRAHGDLAVRQASAGHDRAKLSALLIDAAIRKGEVDRLLEALLARFPQRSHEIDAIRKTLQQRARSGGQRAKPARQPPVRAKRGAKGGKARAGARDAQDQHVTKAGRPVSYGTERKEIEPDWPARRDVGAIVEVAPDRPARRGVGAIVEVAPDRPARRGVGAIVEVTPDRPARRGVGAIVEVAPAKLPPASSTGPGPAADGGGLETVRDPAPPALAEPQIVNLGFATRDAPDIPLIDCTLGAGEWYVLWVKIEPRVVAGSLPGGKFARVIGLHEDDILDVILFGFPDQLDLGPDRHGRIQIRAAGNRVMQPAWAETPPALAETQLCFVVCTPRKLGRAALRCNIYHRGVLLQSHLVSVEVTEAGHAQPSAARRVCDYNLSASLDTRRLGPGTEHLLSILVNDDGQGTHSFRFVSSKAGVPDQIHEGHIDDTQLGQQVSYARTALQWVAWGSEGEWNGDPRTYRFINPPDAETTAEIYRMMARRGFNLWWQIISNFGVRGPEARTLRDTMRQPGRVQIALKSSPDAVVPMAMVYDYPLDPARQNLTVCEVSLAAIAAGKPLDTEPCFAGNCPHYDDDRVVCVGGFWGFRHDIGLPIHVPDGEVATTIARGAAVHGFAPVYIGKDFALRKDHIDALKALASNWLEVIEDRDTCITRLAGEARPLVYFYCHGGLTEAKTPFLQVGAQGSDIITAASFANKFLYWNEPTRPLVILNGCHTTGTSPDAMFSFLSALVSQGNAAGVIGTEITNFEPIAVQIGTELVTRFLAGEEVGHALKLARLQLLRQGNPLGLMYIAFALPILHLV